MAIPALIFCRGGGKASFVKIALEAGWLYGARLPSTIYDNLYFADQDWKKPDRQTYMKDLDKYRPVVATVLDLEREEQFSEVMDWVEEASEFVDKVVIIPKVSGIISRIPKKINNKYIVLGYSVPTKYGGTRVSPLEFEGRPVHLLGGSPFRQMEFYLCMNVESADGNMMNQQANLCRYWSPLFNDKKQNWIQLKETGDNRKDGANLECFRLSCYNIMTAWKWWCKEDRTNLLRGFLPLPRKGLAKSVFQKSYCKKDYS